MRGWPKGNFLCLSDWMSGSVSVYTHIPMLPLQVNTCCQVNQVFLYDTHLHFQTALCTRVAYSNNKFIRIGQVTR